MKGSKLSAVIAGAVLSVGGLVLAPIEAAAQAEPSTDRPGPCTRVVGIGHHYVVIAFPCAANATAAQTSAVATREPPQAEDLREIERERLNALVDADEATAGSLMADDFELIQPLGDLTSRDQLLREVASGSLDYLALEPISDIEVRLYGDAAALRYRGHVQVLVQGLGEIDQQLWHTLIYELRDGQWLAVWEQKTGVGGAAAPSADTAG